MSQKSEQVLPTLIETYEKSYRDSLVVIKNEVESLIKNGREMEVIVLFENHMNEIHKVHKELTKLYTCIYKNQHVLQHYGSKRLQQVGHKLVPIKKLIDNPALSKEEIESNIIKGIREVGVNYQNWAFNLCFLNEIEYMIKVLKILVEPEFVFDIGESEPEDILK